MRRHLAVAALAAVFAVPLTAFAGKFADLEKKVAADLTDDGQIYSALLGALGTNPADVTALQRECPRIPKPTGEIGPKTLECVKNHAGVLARVRKEVADAHAKDAKDAKSGDAADEDDKLVDPRLAVATEAFIAAHCAKKAKARWIEEDARFICRTAENTIFEGKCRISKRGKTSCAEVAIVAALKPPTAGTTLTPKDETFWCNRSVGQGLLCYGGAAVVAGFAGVGIVKAASNDLAVFRQE